MDIVSNCHPTCTHYTDSAPTSLCSFSKCCVPSREAKNTNFSLWSDPTGARTHEHLHANLYAAV